MGIRNSSLDWVSVSIYCGKINYFTKRDRAPDTKPPGARPNQFSMNLNNQVEMDVAIVLTVLLICVPR
jgi:hypothetical protein